MGKRIVRGARGWGVGLVGLGIVLLVAVSACEDSSEGIPTAVPTATSAQVAETPTHSPAPKATLVAAISTLSSTPAPVAEITYSHRMYAGEPEQERVMLFGSITGVLTYEEGHVLPEEALIRIALRTSDKYVGFSNSQPTPLETTQFPMSFVIHCDPCRVDVGWEYFADVRINGPPVGPPPPKPHFGPPPPHVGPLLFVNAIKVTVIDDLVLAKDIEIPVVPRPTLTGNLMASEGENTPVNASGTLLLWDVSQKDADPIFVASTGIEVGGQFPIPFSMHYHPADIDPQGKYVLEAKLRRLRDRACRGVYRSKDAYEVITGGNPTHDLQLEIVQVDKWVSEEVDYVTGTIAIGDLYIFNETDLYKNEYNEEIFPTSQILNNPWLITVMDKSTYCIVAEVEVDGTTPIPVNFSIAYNPSHIDPHSPFSDYVVRVYRRLHTGRYSGSYLKGQTLIRLNPDNPNIHAEVVVHEGRWIE